ncbi:Alpha/Beta hydrolase protein [Cokeromyces recurvatus]|uniref:Alpha/Beta hydrolase protein n=1 Tax=Cokeromyces recurvatus TaxID=90255 RepID=UPI0022201450|nr:Alpha/Beta hydrolase protein [Cokeromyces recurvatus]KAI7906599.1 Alpha/Beta hydrolase protein [Cokeromyces recurvatus]
MTFDVIIHVVIHISIFDFHPQQKRKRIINRIIKQAMNRSAPIHLQSSKSAPVQKTTKQYSFEPHRLPPSPPPSTSPSFKSVNSPTRISALREARLNQTFLFQSNGRLRSHRVGYAIYGPHNGHPAFVIGGYGCTRLVGIMFEELAIRYNIRMIWPERPGYGLSQPISSQRIRALDWAHVVIQLANHLKIDKFSIIAQSVGTVFALAVAYRYPERVVGPIFLISPWVSTQAAQTFKWTRRLPAPLVAKTISLALDVMWMFTKSTTTLPFTKDNDDDDHRHHRHHHHHPVNNSKFRNTIVAFEEDELLASFEEEAAFELSTDFPTQRPLRHFVRPRHISLYLAMNQQRLSESYSQGQLCDVMVALEKYHMFGFSYTDIKVPVSAVWGDKDGLISAKAIHVFANSLHDVRLKILESEGHDLVWKEGVMEWAIRGISERFTDMKKKC